MRFTAKKALAGFVPISIAKAVIHMDTKGRYRDGIKSQGFQTFQSLRNLGIGTVLRHRPGRHGFQEIDLAGLVDKASVGGAYRVGKTARAPVQSGLPLDCPAGVLSLCRQCHRGPDEKVNRQRRNNWQ